MEGPLRAAESAESGGSKRGCRRSDRARKKAGIVMIPARFPDK